jgi:glycosyltransferase involved in cell wall biosynthesis
MNMTLSVVICSHNSRLDYLGRTIDGLRAQSMPREEWELVVVDNASTPPLADRIDLGWHPRGRIVREEQRGKTHAVVRGIREAAGANIVFVDDDNVLDVDYLRIAEDHGRQRPMLGAWGAGVVLPEFEEPPAPQIEPYLRFALRRNDGERWSNALDDWPAIPLGAGLCVRREIAEDWIASMDGVIRRVGGVERASGELVGGEDVFLALHAQHFGLGWGTTPALKILHLIPANRVTKQYLLDITAGYYAQNVVMHEMIGKPIPQPMKRKKLLAKTAELMVEGRYVELEFLRAKQRGIRRGHELMAAEAS